MLAQKMPPLASCPDNYPGCRVLLCEAAQYDSQRITALRLHPTLISLMQKIALPDRSRTL
ncbi:MAG: hypothetical protein KDE63_02640 [Novosphingobium sp.]|nr:hypothetical protein [Novosphingobium sp.]